MKYILLLIIISYSTIFAEGQGSEGGVILTRNGRIATLKSFGITLISERAPLKMREIPGLDIYLKVVESLPIKSSLKIKYQKVSLPSSKRKYYRILEENFDQETKEQLVEIWAMALGIPEAQVSLAAASDIENNITYLFPDFFKLEKIEEQTAIIAHENEWFIRPQASENEIARLEIAFQSYIELKSEENLIDLLKEITTSEDLFIYYFKKELEDGTLVSLQSGISRVLSDQLIQETCNSRWSNFQNKKKPLFFRKPVIDKTTQENIDYCIQKEEDYRDHLKKSAMINFSDLFGKNYINCVKRFYSSNQDYYSVTGKENGIFVYYDSTCWDSAIENIIRLTNENPNSFSLKILLDELLSEKIALVRIKDKRYSTYNIPSSTFNRIGDDHYLIIQNSFGSDEIPMISSSHFRDDRIQNGDNLGIMFFE